MAPHSSPLAWKIPWMEDPSRLQSMGSLRVGHDGATSLSLFTFTFPFPALAGGFFTTSATWEALLLLLLLLSRFSRVRLCATP